MIHMFIKNNGGIPVKSRERTYELTFDRSYLNKLLSTYSKLSPAFDDNNQNERKN